MPYDLNLIYLPNTKRLVYGILNFGELRHLIEHLNNNCMAIHFKDYQEDLRIVHIIIYILRFQCVAFGSS